MPVTLRKVRIVFGPIETQAGDKSLVPPTAAQIYDIDKTTAASIYSDEDGTSLTNTPSVPTGVSAGSPGMDAYGNIVIYGDPGVDYTCLVNSVFMPIPTTGIHGTDFTDHIGLTGTVSDPHGDRAYTDGVTAPITTNVTNNANAISELQGRTAGDWPVDTTNGAQGPSIQAAIDALVASGGGSSGDVLVD